MIQQLTNNLDFVHPFLFFKHRLLWSPCDGAKFKHCIFQLLFDRNNFSLKGWFCYCCSKISFFIFGHLKPETFLLLDLCLLECSLRFSFNFWNKGQRYELLTTVGYEAPSLLVWMVEVVDVYFSKILFDFQLWGAVMRKILKIIFNWLYV
jgi:hypothetical protein